MVPTSRMPEVSCKVQAPSASSRRVDGGVAVEKRVVAQ